MIMTMSSGEELRSTGELGALEAPSAADKSANIEELEKRYQELVAEIDEYIVCAVRESEKYYIDEHGNIRHSETGKVLIKKGEWWEMSEVMARNLLDPEVGGPPPGSGELEQIVRENLLNWLHWREIELSREGEE